jgi:hypothetical protein
MNWERVEHLLVACVKRSAPSSPATTAALGDYAEFLSRYDGAEGFVRNGSYVVLWEEKEIPKLNAAYSVSEFAPDILLIGSNGSSTGFGIDQKTGRYVSVDLLELSREACMDERATFLEFLEARERG